MPQLDFFTFPHQYLVAIICFCGLYYFNLLIFFPQLRWLFINKGFLAIAKESENIIKHYDNYITLLFCTFINLELEEEFEEMETSFLKKFFKKISYIRNDYSNFVSTFFCLFLFFSFFLKNILVFNAEKLMLVYFLILSTFGFFFLKNILKKFIFQDAIDTVKIFANLELKNEKFFFFLKNMFNTLHNDIVKDLILLKLNLILKVKKISLINGKI